MSRAVLVFLALSVLGFGAVFTARPVELAQVVEILLPTPTSRTDFRAVYGGLELGLGMFLLVCALRRHLVRVGLQAAFWALLGMASGRLVGLVADGFGQPLMILFMAIEAVAAGLAIWASLQIPASNQTVPLVSDPVPYPGTSRDME
jgi:hypothetical protein